MIGGVLMNDVKKHKKLINENGKCYIVVEEKKYELDQGETFDLNAILEWIETTKKLSNRKQKMRIPCLSAIRAVGFEENSVNTFLNNESKSGLIAYLRKQDWYKDRHPEIKTVFLKLLAHLNLFDDKSRENREAIINKVLSNFTMLEIHNIFGALIPGTNLCDINNVYDNSQCLDSLIRRKYDPTGEKCIKFFMNNIDNPDFKGIAYYSLTHFVFESYKLDLIKQNYVAQIESQAAKSNDLNIKEASNIINKIHFDINKYIHSNKNDDIDRTKELQDKMESARRYLYSLIELCNDNELKNILNNYRNLPHNLTIDFIKQDLEVPKLDLVKDDELRQSMIAAGYIDADEIEINTIQKLFKKGKNAIPKYFSSNVIDDSNSCYKYKWLFSNDYLLYTIGMMCGGTCMRPGFAGEAALWESVLSPDVCLCAVYSKDNQVIGYMRVNYDLTSHGIYVDTVESRKLIIQNNEEIWNTLKRALIDMANQMNKEGNYYVDVINYREDLGNQLKEQFDKLENATTVLNARPYYHDDVPWIYGDYESRVQKKIWERKKISEGNMKYSMSKLKELSRGATGIVYEVNDREVIKVYPENYDVEKITEEFYKNKIIYDAGIKCPAPYEIVYVGDCLGILMEKINGCSLTKRISSNPHDTEKLMKKMTDILKEIHLIDATGLDIKSLKDRYIHSLYVCKNYYSDEEFNKLIELVNSIPDTNSLLHGDFHTGNIILNDNNELVLIDFLELSYGHPIFDVMAQGAVVPVTVENAPELAEAYHQTKISVLNGIWNSYIREYYSAYSKEDFDNLCKDAILYSRIRNAITKTVAENIPEEYLQLCASKTKELLLPEVDRLISRDKILKRSK